MLFSTSIKNKTVSLSILNSLVLTGFLLINLSTYSQAISNSQQVIPPKTTTLGAPTKIKSYQEKVFFTFFDSNDGLTLNGVTSTMFDSLGNLWIGTIGGGVSKFDGKNFTNYNIQDGLSGNVVSVIFEDFKGNIWFGTDNGATKYNGYYFANYTKAEGLTDENVFAICEDQKGNLWLGLDGGVIKLDVNLITDCHQNICNHNLKIKSDLKTHHEVIKKSFINYNSILNTEGEIVRKIITDQKGNLWFATENLGVIRYNPDTNIQKQYSTKNGLTNNNIQNIYESREGDIWVCTHNRESSNGGVHKLSPNVKNTCKSGKCNHKLKNKKDLIAHDKAIQQKFIVYSSKEGLAGNNVNVVYQDIKNNIWIGTDSGVSKLKKKTSQLNNQFTNYTTKNGLPVNTIKSICEDNVGNIWIGTDGGGIVVYENNLFKQYKDFFKIANDFSFCIFEDFDKNLWIGTQKNGLYVFKNNNFNQYQIQQGLIENNITSITQDKEKNLWIGSRNKGIQKINEKNILNYDEDNGLINNKTRSLTVDINGNIWIGTIDGISIFNGEKFINYSSQNGLIGDYIIAMVTDKAGNVWIGTDKGINYCSFENTKKPSNINFKTYIVNNTPSLNIISSILEDHEGNLWFGTFGDGVHLLKKQDLNAPIFKHISTKDGLPNNEVTAISQDNEDNIFIGTNFGIAVIPKGNLMNKIQVFNQFTQYPIKDVNGGNDNGSMTYAADHAIWYGTGDGDLQRFNYQEYKMFDTQTATPQITKISISREYDFSWLSLLKNKNIADSLATQQNEKLLFNKAFSEHERDSIQALTEGVKFEGISTPYLTPINLVLPHKNNQIAFDFQTIETNRNFLINYKYKLVGFNERWSKRTKKSYVSFNNLADGEYTFSVKSQYLDGKWSKEQKYHFKVLPAWYNTWWMYFIYFFALFLLIYAFASYKTKQLKINQKKLQHKIKISTKEIRKQNKLLIKQKAEINKKHEAKKAMLQEIHHRVKNNLQVVNSLLSLQSSKINDPEVVNMFKETQSRIRSMAKLHEKMYQSGDLKQINAKEYLPILIKEIISNYAVNIDVKLKLDIDEIYLDSKKMMPLSLIINELITNSLKYAFKNKKEGIITVKLLKNNDHNQLIIGDNGTGYVDTEVTHGLGSTLIQSFTQQLNGQLERLPQSGTFYKLTF